MQTEEAPGIKTLPDELLGLLLGRLGLRAMLPLCRVCKQWRGLICAKVTEWAVLSPLRSVGAEWREAAGGSSWFTRQMGDGPGQLRWPCFLTVVPPGHADGQKCGAQSGDVIVSEHGNGRLSVFEPKQLSHRCCLGSEGGPLGGRFCRPTGIAVAPDDGNLLVADCGSGRIARLSLEAGAAPPRAGASRLEQPCGDVRNIKQPYGLAISEDGQSVFFADSRMHRIVEVDGCGSGFLLRCWGRYGAAPGELDHPRGLTIHDGELIVADRGNNRLQIFDLSQRSLAPPRAVASNIAPYGAPSMGGGAFAPSGLSVHDGLLPEFVLQPARIIGGEGRAPGCFCGPYDTAVANSRLIVSEFEGRRVQVLTLGGAPLQILALPGGGAPTGIAASADGRSIFIAQFDLHRLNLLRLSECPPPSEVDAGLPNVFHHGGGNNHPYGGEPKESGFLVEKAMCTGDIGGQA